jgi:hypothetical protein
MSASPQPFHGSANDDLGPDLRYVNHYVNAFKQLGPAAFTHRFRWSVLVGYAVVGPVSERPPGHMRRTLPADPAMLSELQAMQTIERVWPIRKAPGERGSQVVLGAAADGCDLVVVDFSVSSRHCAFAFDRGGCFVLDLGSLNGTSVNARRLEPQMQTRLPDRASLTIGRIQVQYLTRESFTMLVTKRAQPGG